MIEFQPQIDEIIDFDGLHALNDKMLEERRLKNNRPYTDEGLNAKLYNANPHCKHWLDPNCWSGIRCVRCSGWYCL